MKPLLIEPLEARIAPATLTINGNSILEGDNDQTRLVLTVNLSEDSTEKIEVKFTTQGGTALAGSDYEFQTGTLTFNPGDRSKTIEIKVLGDIVGEMDETVNVVLSEATGASIGGDGSGIGTILNDYKITFENVAVAKPEGDSGASMMQFKVIRTDLFTPGDAEVTYATADGTAGAPGDYESSGGTLRFTGSETSKTIDVIINGDTESEPNETFTVDLTSPMGAPLGATRATGTIQNDAKLTISGSASVAESDLVTYTVTLAEGNSDGPTTVKYKAVSGTATAGADFEEASGTLTFQPGGDQSQQITFRVKSDLIGEGAETFSVVLSEPSNGASLVTASASTLITNDDFLNISDVTVNESDAGPKTASFTVSLNSAVPAGTEIWVRYRTQDGTANAGGTAPDYQQVTDGILKFIAGEQTKSIPIQVFGDSTVEGAETYNVVITAVEERDPANGTLVRNLEYGEGAKGSDLTGVGTIVDMPTVSISNATKPEGASGTSTMQFTVTLSQASDVPVTVNYFTIPGTAGAGEDYVSKTGSVTFAPGQTSATVEVEIVGDTVAELDETFLVRLSNPVNATLLREQATGTIQNDESQFQVLYFNPTTGQYDLSSIQVTEEGLGNAPQDVKFIVRRTGDLTSPAEIRYTTADGVNAGGVRGAVGSGARADFAPGSGVATFTSGSQDSAVFTIRINPDSHYEKTEEFSVRLFDEVNGVQVNGPYKVTILDNEVLPTLSISSPYVVEGNSGTTNLNFQVRLSHVDETGTWSLQRQTIDGTAVSSGDKKDFTALGSGALTIAPGETEKSVTVAVAADKIKEVDQTLTLRVTGTDSQGTSVGNRDAIGTIIDDEAQITVQISDLINVSGGSSAAYNESDGNSQNKSFRVTLSGESEAPVTVTYSTRDGVGIDGARAGEDFVGVTDVLTFSPGTISQDVFVTVVNDAIVEGDQSFDVVLSSPNGAILGDAVGTAKILDDTSDRPVVTIQDLSLTEGDNPDVPSNARFTVSLASAAQKVITVDYATQDGSGKATGFFADYLAANGKLTFSPGETTKDVNVTVVSDTFAEADETFSLNLSGSTLTFSGNKSSGIATILNGADSQVGVAISDVRVAENGRNSSGASTANTATFTVELSKAQSSALTLGVSLRSGTAALGEDFSSSATGVTIAANQTTGTFAVQLVADDVFEPTETFFADLTSLPSGVVAAKETGRGTIYNDDARQVNKRTVQWIDLDGDLVTLKVTRGSLDLSNTTLFSFDFEGSSVGGRTLTQVNLGAFGNAFQNASITITTARQDGFDGDANGNLGDGRVNVGVIRAGQFVDSQNFFGVDLGKVRVDGDLGAIFVGDRFIDGISLRRLDVQSMGTHPELIDGDDRQSYVQGTVDVIKVRGDMSGIINIVGDRFGDLNSLFIGGSLKGNALANSGVIQFSGTLRNAEIGSISGSEATGSARIIGDSQFVARIDKLTVKGAVEGGAGDSSAAIQGTSIGDLRIGKLTGGEGANSGQISFTRNIANLAIAGKMVGGSGNGSGVVNVESLSSFRADSVAGGAGNNSGVVQVERLGTFQAVDLVGGSGSQSGQVLSNKINLISISGAIIGDTGEGSGAISGDKVALAKIGNIIGGSGSTSGLLLGETLKRVEVSGDVVGGSGESSGLVFANDSVGSVFVKGRLIGGSGVDSGFINSEGNLDYVKVVGKLPKGAEPLLPAVQSAVTGGTGAGSGRINADDTLDAAVIGGAKLPADVEPVALQGGAGRESGRVSAADLGRAVFNGDVRGGSASSTGIVEVTGKLNSLLVRGNLIGGNSVAATAEAAAVAINTTGAIAAGDIEKVKILGSVISGTDVGGAGLQGSGSIGASGVIRQLLIEGGIFGNQDTPVTIIAYGSKKAPAIASLEVGGDVQFANINVGTNLNNSDINTDARIGSVTIGGDVKGFNLTAGAGAGPDRAFGTADDIILNGQSGINDLKVFSKIASVIIRGQVEPVSSDTGPQPYGFVAQHIAKVVAAGKNVNLQKGPGNDTAPGVEVRQGSGLRVLELPTP